VSDKKVCKLRDNHAEEVKTKKNGMSNEDFFIGQKFFN